MTETARVLTLDTIRQLIHQFIMTNFLFDGVSPEIDDDASLLAAGIVDTTGILELTLFVEDAFGLHVAEGDLAPENFDTVNSIAQYVSHGLDNA